MEIKNWLNDVTKAIQKKLKTNDKILPSEFANKILEIKSGGGGGSVELYKTLPAEWDGVLGTPIPETGYVDTIYINKLLSEEQLNNAMSKVTYQEVESTSMYIMFSTSKGAFGIVSLMGLMTVIGPLELQDPNDCWYIYVDPSVIDSLTGIQLNFLGWNPDFNGEFIIQEEIIGNPENALITELIASEPFKKTAERKETIKEISGEYNSEEINLSIKGGWDRKSGTVIPQTGLIENVYVNTELSFDEVVTLLDQLELTTLNPENGLSIYSIISDDGAFHEGMSIGLGVLYINETRLLVAVTPSSLEEGEKNSFTAAAILPIFAEAAGDFTMFQIENAGWQLDKFTSPLTFNVNAVDSNILFKNPSGIQNDKLTTLFSITPFNTTIKNEINIFALLDEGKLPEKIKVKNTYEEIYNNMLNGNLTSFKDESILTLSNRRGVFAGFSRLSEVQIPNCSNLGDYTFTNCWSLNSLTARPEAFETVNTGLFRGCGSKYNEGNYGYSLRSLISNFSNCRCISSEAFYACNLSQIDFPKCRSVYSYAFGGLNPITSVNLPLCSEIRDQAFANCSFSQAIFPICNSLGRGAFGASVTTLVASPGYLYSRNFDGAYKLSEIYLLNTSTTLADSNAFRDTLIASGNGKIYVPSDKVSTYRSSSNWSVYSSYIYSLPDEYNTKYVYANEFGRRSVEIPEAKFQAETILSNAFSGHYTLTSVSFPNCSYIGNYAFAWCSTLTNINFPKCKYIEYGAFMGCSNLTEADFPECEEVNKAAFSNCSTMSRGSFPVCKRVEMSAFISCYSLTNITLPQCSYFGYEAFKDCSCITTLNLPECTFLHNNVFSGCTNLVSLYLVNSSKTVEVESMSVLQNCPLQTSSGKIYVHAKQYDNYMNHIVWGLFSSQIFSVNN